eukprot:Platyproteum_vivax@DN7239_c0_g1_i10.p1
MSFWTRRGNIEPFFEYRTTKSGRNACKGIASTEHCMLATLFASAWENSNVSGTPANSKYLNYGQEYFDRAANRGERSGASEKRANERKKRQAAKEAEASKVRHEERMRAKVDLRKQRSQQLNRARTTSRNEYVPQSTGGFLTVHQDFDIIGPQSPLSENLPKALNKRAPSRERHSGVATLEDITELPEDWKESPKRV